jgi:hypothetical protein
MASNDTMRLQIEAEMAEQHLAEVKARASKSDALDRLRAITPSDPPPAAAAAGSETPSSIPLMILVAVVAMLVSHWWSSTGETARRDARDPVRTGGPVRAGFYSPGPDGIWDQQRDDWDYEPEPERPARTRMHVRRAR